ncbi:MAG TPA: hypothetical protein VG936_02345 [Lacunisphaera sp.]|nr:hypothetical protein [Lacunisphaera sp.]
MENPGVKSTMLDEEHNVTFHFMAYRKLDEAEMIRAIRAYRSQPEFRRRKNPERNKVITIITHVGMER